MRRRTMTVLGATAVIWMLLTGTALAHFCYVVERSERGNAGAAGSNGWISIEDLLTEEGFCPEAIAYLEAEFLEARGLTAATPIHQRTLLAGPHAFTPKVSDGKGIDHIFTSVDDFGEVVAIEEEALALCNGD